MSDYILWFTSISNSDISKVGGKNASLGEMVSTLASSGIKVPEGFAITASAYRLFVKENKLYDQLDGVLKKLNTKDLANLPDIGRECRQLIEKASFPGQLSEKILEAYHTLSEQQLSVAVRSSATAEDLPTASFAGQHDSFLNRWYKEQ